MPPDCSPYDALLLVSFGGPERPEDVVPFLKNVTAGRGIPEERLAAVGEHYFAFGGRSPINDQNRALLAGIVEDLRSHGIDLPVYWGNRNWDPLLADTVEQMRDDGVTRAACFLTSAYASYSGCRQYREDLAGAIAGVEGAPRLDRLRQYFNHPGFVEPMVDNTLAALADLPGDGRHDAHLVFVTGPALVTFLSTAYAAETGLVVALVVGTVGPVALALQRRTEPPAARDRAPGERGPIPWPTLVPVTITGAALGSLFGAMEVATVAFATDHGHRAASGALLAILSLGSLIAGVLAGARTSTVPLVVRIRVGMTALTAGFVLLPLVDTLWLLGLLMFLAGFAIAPTLIAVLSLVEQVSPRGRLTEAMAWVSTGLAGGIAPGAWLAGVVADHSGGSAAFWVSVVSGGIAAAAAWATPAPRPSLASAP
jgi:hypothetical protein